jgi:hypothetical protein
MTLELTISSYALDSRATQLRVLKKFVLAELFVSSHIALMSPLLTLHS